MRRLHVSAGSMLALWLACTVQSPASTARADDTAVLWLRGSGAETCISDAELLAALRHVGADTTSRAPDGRIEGRIDAVPGGFNMVVRAVDVTGGVQDERRVSATVDDCRTLDDALVVILALMLDGLHRSLPPEVDARSGGPRLDLTLGVGVASGPLPGPALEGTLGLSWTRRRLIVEGAFFSGLGQSVPAVEGSLDGFRMGARVTACGLVWRSPHASLGLCGWGEVGRLVMQTHELLGMNDTSRMAHARLGLGARFRYHATPRLTLWAEAAAHVALGRPSVSVLSAGQPVEVYRAASVAGTLQGGVAWRVP